MVKLETLKEIDYVDYYCVNILLNNLREKYKDTMITDWAHINKELRMWGRSSGIIEFLLRIYYWSDLVDGSKDYWSEQIYLLYHDVPRQKGRNKHFPLKEKIHDSIRGPFTDEDFINNELCSGIKDEPGYKELPKIIVEQNGLEFCDKYIWWLSEKLSTNGKVEKNEVKGIIDKLIKER